MKNTISKVCVLGLFALGTIYSNTASAQFETDQLSLGAGIGLTKHAGDLSMGSVSFNIRGNYELDEKGSVVLSFNTQLPITLDEQVNAQALSSTTNPSSVPVDISSNLSFYNISADYHRYFISDIEETFGMYGIAGIGLSFVSRGKATLSDYDQTQYSTGIQEEAINGETFNGFMINLGLGANYNVSDMVSIFAETKMGLPAGNKYNSREGDVITNPVPFNYYIQAGARFNLFD